MATAHVLAYMDTLQSLALQYLGDATSWTTISDYNNLASPYIVSSKDDTYQFYGSGYATVIRSNTAENATVRKGCQFKTKPTLFEGSVTRTFEVTEDTVIPAGVATAYLPLRCTAPGTFGNVMEYMITEAGSNLDSFSDTAFVAIYNEACFTGGCDINVLIVGDTIYIPVSSSEEAITQNSTADYVNGEDLVLDIYGNLVFDDSGGDLSSASGALNVKYAVIARVTTMLNELTMHPTYGSEVQDLIGNPNIANQTKLIEVAVLRALASEDRIDNVTINSVTTLGTSVSVDISYTLTSNSTSDSAVATVAVAA